MKAFPSSKYRVLMRCAYLQILPIFRVMSYGENECLPKYGNCIYLKKSVFFSRRKCEFYQNLWSVKLKTKDFFIIYAL